jgi:hypothetical protein
MIDTDELIRRASEGCEGPMDDPCFKTKIPLHLWCDPCRCQEAAKVIKAERASVDALTAALRALETKWRKEVAGGWRNGVVIAIERCADDLAVLLDERGSR